MTSSSPPFTTFSISSMLQKVITKHHHEAGFLQMARVESRHFESGRPGRSLVDQTEKVSSSKWRQMCILLAFDLTFPKARLPKRSELSSLSKGQVLSRELWCDPMLRANAFACCFDKQKLFADPMTRLAKLSPEL